jgi:hypothetical protein
VFEFLLLQQRHGDFLIFHSFLIDARLVSHIATPSVSNPERSHIGWLFQTSSVKQAMEQPKTRDIIEITSHQPHIDKTTTSAGPRATDFERQTS